MSNGMIPNVERMLNLVGLLWLCLVTTEALSGDGQHNKESANQQAEQTNAHADVDRLLVMTTAQDVDDETFRRFNRSIETYKLDLSVLRWPSKHKNKAKPSGQRDSQLNLLKRALSTHRNEPGLLIMIVDSQNSIVNSNQKAILNRLAKFDAKSRIIFAADSVCWPDTSLASQFPAPAPATGGEKFLNSGAYIGFAPALWDLLNWEHESDLSAADSQSYYVRAYLNETIRDGIGLRLDHRAELFQNLRPNKNLDPRLEFDSDGAKLKNWAHHSEPVVAVGNKENRLVLDSLGNYLAKAWTPEDGCRYCDRDKLTLPQDDNALPTVLIGVFIECATPFLGQFFEALLKLNYPSKKIHLLVHSPVVHHESLVAQFLSEHGAKYASQRVVPPQEPEWRARDAGLRECRSLHCDHYLSLDGVARIELADTLRILIETNKTIVAPLLNRPTKLWSNFWGSVSADGYYARSHDYLQLVRRDRLGVWSVAHVMDAYLLSGRLIRDHLPAEEAPEEAAAVRLSHREHNSIGSPKPVLVFSRNLREAGLLQHMVNTHEFGHLVDPSSYNSSLVNADFYQLAENVLDWERTYLHENYSRLLDGEEDEMIGYPSSLEQPCPDVFWFPLVSDTFCRQLIEIMESFGQWSGGTNHDPRIEGGYESVPTRDIHMKQVGLHELWLQVLRDYVMPVQLKEFVGYEHDPPRADLAFVVRYHPQEQASLEPHHDSSTYTLNIALNSPGLHYEGGGCRFRRYNCSVTDSRLGWALMHPGRLTHYHEGLPVTSGTRYIMVSFVDP